MLCTAIELDGIRILKDWKAEMREEVKDKGETIR